MGFWDDFKTLANYRIAFHLQNIFLNAFKSAKRKYDDEVFNQQIQQNKEEIISKTKNTPFTKKRKTP